MSKAFQPIRRTVTHPKRQLARGIRLVREGAEKHRPPVAPRDVWHWTQPKYRIRAAILLLIDAALFVGLGCFTFWLRTGHYTPLSGRPYGETWMEAFDPGGPSQITLIDFLLYPIPVDQVPLMMPIVGLVLASLTAIPILVSMLYRFPFSLIFTAIIAFVAVSPWLAMTVTLCCFLARWRPLQFNFRLATALISLLPVVVYYALATRGVSAAAQRLPVDMAKLYVPWIIALIGACVVMALVLLIAKLVNYRPGAIAPLMAVLFAVPVVLFEAKVGRDELYYRLLQFDYGPNSRTHFVAHIDAAELIGRVAEQRLDHLKDPAVSLASMAEQVQLDLQIRLASARAVPEDVAQTVLERFAQEQYEASRASRRFCERYGGSRYRPNALYLEGRALDMRVDDEFILDGGTLIVQYYQDFPNAASKPAWRELHDRFPDSPLASVAGLRLAILETRGGRVDVAIGLLKELFGRFGGGETAPPQRTAAGGLAGVLAKRPASSTLGVDPAAVVLEGRKLYNLLVENRDPQQDDLPLRRLFSFDPQHPKFQQNLQELLAEIPTRYPLTPLRDNLLVLIARSSPSPPSRSVRIQRLQACVEELSHNPASDALPQARFELGVAYQDDYRSDDARKTFEDLIAAYPNSPWAADANRKLAAMGMAPRSDASG